MSRKHTRNGTRRTRLNGKPYSLVSVVNSVQVLLVSVVTLLFTVFVEAPVRILEIVKNRLIMMVGKRSGGGEDGLSEKKRARLANKESKLRAEYSLVVGGDGERGRLGEEEFKAMKKELAERKRLLMQLPRFILNSTTGASASIFSTEYSSRTPLLLSDIEHLVTYAYGGNLLVSPPSRWCQMQKPNRLAGVVVLVVDGVGLTEFVDNEVEFGRCMGIFGGDETNRAIVEFLSPGWYGSSVEKEVSDWGVITGTSGSSPVASSVPDLPANETTPANFVKVLQQLSSVFPINTAKYKEKEPPTTDVFPRTDIILTLPQMIQERYPLPIPANTIDRDNMRFRPTADKYKPVNARSKMYSIDCEMCVTREDPQALCKIAVVDEGLGVVYESLVKPDCEVVDYLTRWSGVTKGMMEGVSVRLGDVQEVLRGLVEGDSDCVFVGQSLGCDLRAVRMTHPYVIDTSVVFNLSGFEGKKTSLRDLALNLLDEEIQVERRNGEGGGKGHCPVEDATAAMKLVKKKLGEGVTFGNAVKNVKYLKQSTRVVLDHGLSGVRQGKLDKNVLLVYKTGSDDGDSQASEDVKPTTLPKDTPPIKQEQSDDDSNVTSHRKVTRIDSMTNGNTIKHLSNNFFEYFLSVGFYKIDNEDPDSFRKSIVKLDKRVSKLFNRVGDNSMVVVVCSKDCGEGKGCGVHSDVVRRNNGVAFVRVKGGGRRE